MTVIEENKTLQSVYKSCFFMKMFGQYMFNVINLRIEYFISP